MNQPKNLSLFSWACLIALAISTAQQASADPIVYGDMISAEVSYLRITENSTTDPFPPQPTDLISGLYGTPEMFGDTLLFNVPTFAAQAIGGPEVDLTDGFLTFGMAAGDGMLLTRLFIEEFGSLNLLGGLTDMTNAGIASPVFVDIQEIVIENGTPEGLRVAIEEPVTITGLSLNVSPTPNAGPVFGFESDPGVVSWIAKLDVDLVAELVAARPGIGTVEQIRGISQLQFSMNNTLSASSETALATAFIDKKQVSINPTVIENVPEPVSMSLLLLIPFAAGLRRLRS